MARREVTGNWTRDDRIAINENFRKLFEEYVGAGLDAAEAKEKAIQAVADSLYAKQTAETTRDELTRIIREQTAGGDVVPEVVQARGTHSTVGDRLNSISQDLAQTAAQKADKSYVDSKVQGVSLAFKESYNTLADLEQAYPNGNEHNHGVFSHTDSDGVDIYMIYTWSNGAWTNTQIQANGTGIADKSVTDEKLVEKYLNGNVRKSKNLFNKDKVTEGYYVGGTGGGLVPYPSSSVSEFIPINPAYLKMVASGIYTNYAGGGAFYSTPNLEGFISGFSTAQLLSGDLNIPSNGYYTRISVPLEDLATAQLEYGSVASDYEEYGKNYLREKSLPYNVLSDEAINELTGMMLSGIKILMIGDSITWLDGRTVEVGGHIIGYQEQLRKSGAIVTSHGNSGATYRRYVEGISNINHGSLYVDVVVNQLDVSGFDVIGLIGGANDIGRGLNLGTIDSTDPDTTLGALNLIIDYIRTNNPTARIVLFTPIQRKRVNTQHVPDMYGDSLRLVGGLIELGNDLGIKTVNMHIEAGIGRGNMDEVLYDNVHPNNIGMELMGKAMINHLA